MSGPTTIVDGEFVWQGRKQVFRVYRRPDIKVSPFMEFYRLHGRAPTLAEKIALEPDPEEAQALYRARDVWIKTFMPDLAPTGEETAAYLRRVDAPKPKPKRR